MTTLTLVGLVLLALAGAVGTTTIAQRDARRHAAANGDALIAVTRVGTDLLDAETGQRGYLLTDDETYLAPYTEARGRIAADLTETRRLYATRRNAGTAQSLVPLERLSALKVAELDRTIVLQRAGRRSEALATVTGGEGKRVMDAIGVEVERLATRERDARNASIARAQSAEMLLLPLEAVLGAVMLVLIVAALRGERRRAAAAALAAQADALRDANERGELLLRELNHRVKNIFAVIMSLIGLSSRRHPEGRTLGDDLRARVHALALAHSASLGEGDIDAVPLRSVLERCIEPYDHDRFTLEGPDVVLPVRAITPIGLVIHELATNAVKHGVLGGESGEILLDWSVSDMPQDRKIAVRWIESGLPALVGHTEDDAGGFGTTMMALASRQLGGTMTRSWRSNGLAVVFEFKLD